MNKQLDRMTAYYYRAAQKQTEDLYLDNQMQKLLYHAKKNGITAYTIYADNGYSGVTLDRPAFQMLTIAIQSGQIQRVIATGLDRISRNSVDVMNFADLLAEHGATLETLNGDCNALETGRQLFAALFQKGGVER